MRSISRLVYFYSIPIYRVIFITEVLSEFDSSKHSVTTPQGTDKIKRQRLDY